MSQVVTFADVEASLMRIELARLDGRHREFAEAVGILETIIARLRWIPEIESEADDFIAAVEGRQLVWRSIIDERRRDILPERSPSTVGMPSPDTTTPGVLRAAYIRIARSSRVHLSLAMFNICMAALATEPFFAALGVMMFAASGACAMLPSFRDWKSPGTSQTYVRLPVPEPF